MNFNRYVPNKYVIADGILGTVEFDFYRIIQPVQVTIEEFQVAFHITIIFFLMKRRNFSSRILCSTAHQQLNSSPLIIFVMMTKTIIKIELIRWLFVIPKFWYLSVLDLLHTLNNSNNHLIHWYI